MQLVNQEQMPPESHSQQHATTFAHGHEAVEVVYVCLKCFIVHEKTARHCAEQFNYHFKH